MKKAFPLFLVLFALVQVSLAQVAPERCGSMDVDQRLRMEDPDYILNRDNIEQHTRQWIASESGSTRTVITIPVVVHVVWNTTAENVSDAQILEQIDVLNDDFRRLNSDAGNTASVFLGVAADCEVQFCMAARDPSGNATNGIVRVNTSVTSFNTNDNVKKSANGGSDIWDRNKYLNIWVCDLSSTTIGYAQFPGGPSSTDGVVVDFEAFGIGSPADPPFDLGRTATHEVGHWLNCYHTFQGGCGGTTANNCATNGDLVCDTPPDQAATFGCPTGTPNTCTETSPFPPPYTQNMQDMFQNFMDYTDDDCMNLFTLGQKSRMQAIFGTGGSRVSIVTSDGCVPPGATCTTPTGLSASSITSSSATVSWGSVASATSYNIDYKPTSSGTWTTTTSTTASKSLTGLSANTQYDYKVQAVCGATTSAYSSVANFTTSTGGGCSDVFEPNNSKAKAKAISTGTDYTALIASSTDKDWFSFSNNSTEKNIQILITDLPEDYDVKLFNPSNTKVASSQNSGTDDETINYNTSVIGTYKIQVYGFGGVFDPSDCYNFRVNISSTPFKLADDVADAAQKTEISLFPNPAQSTITVQFQSAIAGEARVNVYSLTGQLLHTVSQQAAEGLNTWNIDLTSLNNGMFLLELVNENSVTRKSFEIVR